MGYNEYFRRIATNILSRVNDPTFEFVESRYGNFRFVRLAREEREILDVRRRTSKEEGYSEPTFIEGEYESTKRTFASLISSSVRWVFYRLPAVSNYMVSHLPKEIYRKSEIFQEELTTAIEERDRGLGAEWRREMDYLEEEHAKLQLVCNKRVAEAEKQVNLAQLGLVRRDERIRELEKRVSALINREMSDRFIMEELMHPENFKNLIGVYCNADRKTIYATKSFLESFHISGEKVYNNEIKALSSLLEIREWGGAICIDLEIDDKKIRRHRVEVVPTRLYHEEKLVGTFVEFKKANSSAWSKFKRNRNTKDSADLLNELFSKIITDITPKSELI